jgi:hypothetical protein
MSRADDLLNSVQKAVGDGPVQLLVGMGDLVSEKLRELPEAVTTWQEENRDFPMRAAGALIGSAFRANLKVGELYDELTRRGQDVMTKMRGEDVVAEEDEPFVHEPFMPEPVRRLPPQKTSHAKHAEASMTSATRAAGAKSATKSAKKVAKKAATKKVAAKKTPAKKAAAKTGAKKAPAKAGAKKAGAKVAAQKATSN